MESVTDERAAAALAAATFLAGRRCSETVMAETVIWFFNYITKGRTKQDKPLP